MGEVLALQPEDLAILDLECPTIVGHTCKVVRLAPGPVDVAALRRRVASRIDEVPILTRRLGGSAPGRVWVVDDSFDIDRHIGPADVRLRWTMTAWPLWSPICSHSICRAIVRCGEWTSPGSSMAAWS